MFSSDKKRKHIKVEEESDDFCLPEFSSLDPSTESTSKADKPMEIESLCSSVHKVKLSADEIYKKLNAEDEFIAPDENGNTYGYGEDEEDDGEEDSEEEDEDDKEDEQETNKSSGPSNSGNANPFSMALHSKSAFDVLVRKGKDFGNKEIMAARTKKRSEESAKLKREQRERQAMELFERNRRYKQQFEDPRTRLPIASQDVLDRLAERERNGTLFVPPERWKCNDPMILDPEMTVSEYRSVNSMPDTDGKGNEKLRDVVFDKTRADVDLDFFFVSESVTSSAAECWPSRFHPKYLKHIGSSDDKLSPDEVRAKVRALSRKHGSNVPTRQAVKKAIKQLNDAKLASLALLPDPMDDALGDEERQASREQRIQIYERFASECDRVRSMDPKDVEREFGFDSQQGKGDGNDFHGEEDDETYGLNEIPIIQLHCIDRKGGAALVRVHCVLPYFYVKVPEEVVTKNNSILWKQSSAYRINYCRAFAEKLESQLRKDTLDRFGNPRFIGERFVVSVEVVPKASIFNTKFEKKVAEDGSEHYDVVYTPHLKVTLSNHNLLSFAREFLAGSLQLQLGDMQKTLMGLFLSEKDTGGQTWFTLPAGKYKAEQIAPRTGTIAERAQTKRGPSLYSVELDVNFEDIEFHSYNDPKKPHYAEIAPMKIISFDIECASLGGHFPKAELDPVVSVAVGVNDSRLIESNLKVAVFMWKVDRKSLHKDWKTDQRALERGEAEFQNLNEITLRENNAEVFMFDDEKSMLLGLSDFFRHQKAQLYTGYNLDFDNAYLLDRAAYLEIRDFHYWSPMIIPCELNYSIFSSQAAGKQLRVSCSVPGAIMYDFMRWIKENDKTLDSYTLNNVASVIIGMTKTDLHHSLIGKYFYGPQWARELEALYNSTDVILPLKLLAKTDCLVQSTELCRCVRVPMAYLMSRGQQLRTISKLHPKMAERKRYNPDKWVPPEKRRKFEDKEKYEGATVVEPKKGKFPAIATLDFASLYPSIMQTHNLCYSSQLHPEEARRTLKPEQYRTYPLKSYTYPGENEICFAKSSVYKGILPEVLDDILDARTLAKKAMGQTKDPNMKKVLNGRQLSLKISANSVYGFTGAETMNCKDIAQVVTYIGRQCIQKAADIVTDYFNDPVRDKEMTVNGVRVKFDVIYGDTDSIMIYMDGLDREDCQHCAKWMFKAKDLINDYFNRVNEDNKIQIEFEKVIFEKRLYKKKNYTGFFVSPEDVLNLSFAEIKAKYYKPEKLKAKGNAVVRRDKIRFVRRICKRVAFNLACGKKEENTKYLQQEFERLLSGKIGAYELVMSSSLADYYAPGKAKPAQAVVAEKKRKRDPESAPRPGDRVAILYTLPKKNKVTEQAEDPEYVLKHNVRIDYLGYFQRAVRNALEDLMQFDYTKEEMKDLFWDMEKRVKVDESLQAKRAKIASQQNAEDGKKSSANIFSFFKTQAARCTKCGAQTAQESMLCEKCALKGGLEMAQSLKIEHEELKKKNEDIWEKCRVCSKGIAPEACTNTDCADGIYYQRIEIQRDFLSAKEDLDKLRKTFKCLNVHQELEW